MSAGKLPEGWVECELSELGNIVTGKTPSTKEPSNFGGNIPFIKPGDLDLGGYIMNTADTLTEKGLSLVPTLPANSVVVTCIGNLGKVGITAKKSASNQQINALIPSEKLNVKFVYYQILTLKPWLESQSAATTIAIVNKGKFSQAPFKFPPLAEQKIIAEKLDTLLAQVDSTKARLEQIPQILKRFRQAVLSAAVSGNISGENDKFKRIHVDDFWSHDVVGLTHWREYKFSEIVDIIGGSQPPKSEFKYEMEEGYIRLIQIRDYKSDSHKVYIPLNKAKRFVEKHDVMIGRYGPPIFQILRGLEGAYNVALMKAVPKSELLDNEYLYWFLQNYKLYNFIEAGSDRTAGQSGVNKKHLESYPVLLPPIHEQAEIVRRVEQLFAYADTIEKQVNNALARVNNLTQSILAKAFRGELTAQWRAENPDLISGENSAAALLEKIKAERAASGGKKASRKKS
ncbi:restriction endonuclease subunit S [Escherichia fergusonii]|uniref:restriction endonuclease subunit S n=1 Tax=Escherichia fergusonii TaxID=564 RepID=UPI000CF77647|nr:restriction endonuclease subunit S [Escherichia fergusonii]